MSKTAQMMKKGAVIGALVMLTMAPEASAQVSCSTSVTPLSFGTYRPFIESHTDSAAGIVVTCSGPLGTTIAYETRMSAGQSGDVYNRALSSSESIDEMAYQLYVDPSYSAVWGDGITGTSGAGVISLVAPTGFSTNNVYGRIFKKQAVRSGQYSDYITVSVVF
ncbi:spore coat U domain-containing protein [Hellea sp.]|nr:spore coat U domain-containing protein [Hellea sp.]